MPLLFGPSPVHPLPRLSAALGGGVEIWAKGEDCNSGIAFGGNEVRKLEYLVADALAQGCDTLVSIGGVQSNHTHRRVEDDRADRRPGHPHRQRHRRSHRRRPGPWDHEITVLDGYAGPAYGIPDESTIEAIHLGGQPALSAYAGAPGLGSADSADSADQQ